MSSELRTLLTTAFANGGYISGGFACHLVRLRDDVPLIDDEKACKLNHFAHMVEQPLRSDAPWNMSSDIDLFFPDEEAFERTWAALNHGGIESRTGAAINMRLDNQIKAQLIKAYTGTPTRIMSTFDMVNCMCAVTENEMIHETRFQQLEKDKKLRVVSWQSPFTIYRLWKYLRRDAERRLDDDSRKAFVPALLELGRRAASGEFDSPDYNMIGKEQVFKKLRFIAHEFLNQMDDNELLMMSLVKTFATENDHDAAYNYAFKELLKRHTLQQQPENPLNNPYQF